MKNCLIPEVALGKTDINASKVRYLSLAQIRNNVKIRTLSLSASFLGVGVGVGGISSIHFFTGIENLRILKCYTRRSSFQFVEV